MPEPEVKFLQRDNPGNIANQSSNQSAYPSGYRTAYRAQPGKSAETGRPSVVFCSGFRSDMEGSKAVALAGWCAAHEIDFLRFDYFGHGQSEGDFLDGTMSLWRQDVFGLLDALTTGPQILVGSSFGGWLSLMAAAEMPETVSGLVLVAPAVDMTERLMWARFSPEARQQLENEGIFYDPSDYDAQGYPITKALIEDGRQYLMLDKPSAIPIDVPVRILHGQEDHAVPWQLSLELAEKISGQDVELHFVKNGDHSLSAPDNLELLTGTLKNLIGF